MITSYIRKVLRTKSASELIAYWPLNERSGLVAYDKSSNAYHGTYSNVELSSREVAGPDGGHCPKFNGSTSYVDIYAAQPSQPTTIGSAMIWFACEKNVLDNTTLARLLTLAANATTDVILLEKTATANTFRLAYVAGSATDAVSPTIYTQDADQFPRWHQLVLTWTKAGEVVKAYVDGLLVGTSTTLGVWSGNMAAATMTVGADNTTPTSVFSGWLAHCALWSVVLTADEIIELSKCGP